jgi:hypothetical protein
MSNGKPKVADSHLSVPHPRPFSGNLQFSRQLALCLATGNHLLRLADRNLKSSAFLPGKRQSWRGAVALGVHAEDSQLARERI